ncbi:MAG TPA: tol-pal system protein YbgF [Candidatus Dormibacteraeota bacterium]|nr:tol-pal system protein YbgF [Candidatus Dormibacteraeota bacterium]
MRGRGIAITSVAVAAALVLGALLSPPPADAVAKEIIQLQQQVAILMQNQQSMQNQMTQNFAVLKTMVGQAVDSQNQLATTVGSLQKTVQEMQASSGSQDNSMSSQVQAISGTLEDVEARLGKLSSQLATTQNSLQSLDAKVTALGPPPQQPMPGGAEGNPPGAPGAPGQPGTDASAPSAAPTASGPPPPADLLYTNALRDFTSGSYSLAGQEFRQYLQYYPQTDLASNAYFYLGEIAYAQGRFPDAISEYNQVLNNYPHSFKRADARLKKAYSLLKLKENGPAIAELRRVIRENPGTEQARKAEARLRELGVRSR